MRTRNLNPIRRRSFEGAYGIRILGDDDRDDHPDIVQFLKELQQSIGVHTPPSVIANVITSVEDGCTAEVRETFELLGQHFAAQLTWNCFLFTGEYEVGGEPVRVATGYADHGLSQMDLTAFVNHTIAAKLDERMVWSAQPSDERVHNAAIGLGVSILDPTAYRKHLATVLSHRRMKGIYVAADIDKRFVPPLATMIDRRRNREGSVLFDTQFEEWLSGQQRQFLVLLGRFGSGKTWSLYRLAVSLSSPRGRVPLYLSLSAVPPGSDLLKEVLSAVGHTLRIGVVADDGVLTRLHDEGRLLLILDRYDELAIRHGCPSLKGFMDTLQDAYPRAKIVISCRSEFLALDNPDGSTLDDLADQADIVELTDFSHDRLREAFRRRYALDWERRLDYLLASPLLGELRSRPALVDLAAYFPSEGEPDSVVSMLERYLDIYMSDRFQPHKASLSPSESRHLAQELAWMVNQNASRSVDLSTLARSAAMQQYDKLMQQDTETLVRSDLTTRAYISVDEYRKISFTAEPFQSFFLARKVAALLGKTQSPKCFLTESVVECVYYHLQGVYAYSQRVQDGMCYVPPGPCIVGSEVGSDLRVENLRGGFWIDRFPVTNAQFARFLNAKGNQQPSGIPWIETRITGIFEVAGHFEAIPGREMEPVVGISWDAARAYAAWTGKRLPSEIEWEKAGRGIDGRSYPWGQRFDTERCNTEESGIGHPTPVGQYGPQASSPYGCEDMAGNVWEWTATSWADDVTTKVIKGGSWSYEHRYATARHRNGSPPYHHSNNLGFRCARDADF
jgi:serine/threonine-protein kinase